MSVGNSPNSSTKCCFQCPIIRHENLKHEDSQQNLKRNHDKFLDVKRKSENHAF